MTGYDQSDDEADAEVEPGSITEFWMNKIIAEKQAEAVAAERERIANLLPRFMHGEMFDETPESDLDLDATAFAMGERFRVLIGAYPYREAER